jgi:hypothetical protein
MTRQIALALAMALAVVGSHAAPAAAAYEFYIRIQGPKPAKPPSTVVSKHVAVIAFEFSVTSPRDAASGQATGKRQWGPITIVREAPISAVVTIANAGISPLTSPSPGANAGVLHEIVTVGCDGLDVQADYGQGAVRGVLAAQSVDGLCIFGVSMPSQSANAIVRIGLTNTPPGWSFNSPPQSKCVHSGETLDGTLGASPGIFSFQWGAARSGARLAGPCGKP